MKTRKNAGILVGLGLVLAFSGPVLAAEAPSFTIPAYAFDRSNAKVFTDNYVDGEPMVAYGGEHPVVIDYDIDFPVAGKYAVHVFFAAAADRPVELRLDGKKVADCCRTAQGGWNTSKAKWEKSAEVEIGKGKHTIGLYRDGAFPHVVSLKFEMPSAPPAGWKLDRPKANKLGDQPAKTRVVAKGAAKKPAAPPVWKTFEPTEINTAALRLAIDDLIATFGDRYPKGREYLERLNSLEAKQKPLSEKGKDATREERDALKQINADLVALQREALLANPLLDFEKLLLVKRHNKAPSLGLPRNWQSNSSLSQNGYDDQIAVLSPVRPEGNISTLFKPEKDRFVGDVDLHFDSDRMLFSMPGDNRRWQVFEIKADGSGLRQLTGDQPDVDSYDACYLPNGDILFTSTACFIGVPCVYGSSHVTNLFRMDSAGQNIRRLTVDQEHDWCPTVLENGRVLYSRWEYTDTPHSNTRLLFHMNPDGTEQMEFLGSNSYWPNSFFYARPIPGHPTKVISVIGGHHDNPRMGELVLFDAAKGRYEATGAVQRIPGYGKKVEPIIRDGLTNSSWPKFLHPYPLSEKYFLVSCKPNAGALWGIYLVDVFDNMVPIRQEADYALLEPVPFRATSKPPVVPDKVDLARTDALVYIPDIYQGDGLRGVPRGTVKELRIYTYHFAYQGMGGLLGVIGADGPWDIRRVIGTVPVNSDGSAKFRIPANTPIAMQPLDNEGKAIQLMRSWMTAMPGEVVQCAGCHERQSTAPPPVKTTIALNQKPAEIAPWRGPTRGFNYDREVQPIIDKYCVGCHNGQPGPDGVKISDLRGTERLKDWKSATPGNGGGHAGKFSVGYAELHRYVRRNGIEGDYHVLEPMEFHADTTELVQMLKRGHYNVKLDAEAWDRLITWIDMNCPFHGTWSEELAKPGEQVQRRRELLKLYANVDDDPEAVPAVEAKPVTPILPKPAPTGPTAVACPNWPFDADEAKRRQQAAGPAISRKIDLGDGLAIEMMLIPAGDFVMGSAQGADDEKPLARVKIDRSFWMAKLEITNQIYNRFNPDHDSRVEDKNTYQFGIHGYPSNLPEQPVVRVSWTEAAAFCRWLSEKTGERFSLPTESQWEWACRAGAATPFYFGNLDADFSKFANLADVKLREFASNPYTVDQPIKNATKYDDWIPRNNQFDDGALLAVAPGRYQPNAWGLCDMHGNAAEWTRSTYTSYPYVSNDGRDAGDATGRKVVRGGSWRDEPRCSTASFRTSYLPWQRVYNVSFRVVCEVVPVVARK